jgi:2'-5' RNA ligase
VIWVGLHGDLARLEELQHAVQAAAAGFGSHAEPREFHPHLTLGRLQRGTIAPRNLSEALAELPGPRTLSWTVRQLHLMRSELRSEGARHTVMSAIALRGPG